VNINTEIPRQLGEDFKLQLNSMLERFKGKAISVTAVQGNQEGYNFAEQIKEYLGSIGWDIPGINVATIFGKHQKGVEVDQETGNITVWEQ